MAKQKKHQQHEEEEEKLNGTLAAVMVLGFFLIASWVFVFDLFLSRF
ncbi:cytochrome c oxidase subunit 2A [Planococcus lenghuensis]|nr:cytochrome c oxidase subunit 2A [Planococcus lenghuensis]